MKYSDELGVSILEDEEKEHLTDEAAALTVGQLNNLRSSVLGPAGNENFDQNFDQSLDFRDLMSLKSAYNTDAQNYADVPDVTAAEFTGEAGSTLTEVAGKLKIVDLVALRKSLIAKTEIPQDLTHLSIVDLHSIREAFSAYDSNEMGSAQTDMRIAASSCCCCCCPCCCCGSACSSCSA